MNRLVVERFGTDLMVTGEILSAARDSRDTPENDEKMEEPAPIGET